MFRLRSGPLSYSLDCAVQWTSAPNIAGAPLPQRARSYWRARIRAWNEGLERLLEAERAQLPPWFVVGLGTGIAAWFALGRRVEWAAFLCFAAGLALSAFLVGTGRAGRALGWFALAASIGCGLIWARAGWVAQPRLQRPQVVTFDSRVVKIEPLVATGMVRLTLSPTDPSLPSRVRVSIREQDAPAGLL